MLSILDRFGALGKDLEVTEFGIDVPDGFLAWSAAEGPFSLRMLQTAPNLTLWTASKRMAGQYFCGISTSAVCKIRAHSIRGESHCATAINADTKSIKLNIWPQN
ncbi:MAG: hypothetical protein NTX50_26075 [Candidatus Sumerlaeota bacterium]|nr:hypothetical protein [Candidatus Sumerlaeota bacterium]